MVRFFVCILLHLCLHVFPGYGLDVLWKYLVFSPLSGIGAAQERGGGDVNVDLHQALLPLSSLYSSQPTLERFSCPYSIQSHVRQDDRNALFFACEHCHKAVAAFLVGNGVDVNAKDGPSGHAPLHRACIAGQTRDQV